MKTLQMPTEKMIIQHNMITNGRYDFTACQLDILFILLAQFKKDDPVDKVYEVHISDIEKITGRLWNYDQLKVATEGMGIRMFSIETNTYLEQMWLFGSFKYMKGSGYFTVSVFPQARPYFFDLKNNFTCLQLSSILACSSKYAKRLYALACQWKTIGKIEITISELKEILYLKDPDGIQKEQLVKISEFKARVLNIAKRQINKQTNICFDYQLKKKGKSFETTIIQVSEKNNAVNKVIEINQPLDFQKNVRSIMAYGISQDIALLIAKNHFNDFEKLIEQMKKDIRKNPNKFEDSAAYIVAVFQKKGVLSIKK